MIALSTVDSADIDAVIRFTPSLCSSGASVWHGYASSGSLFWTS